jgi:hypothetical protein
VGRPVKQIPPGARFGRLTVLAEAGRNPRNNLRRFRVRCDCGYEYEVGKDRLVPTNPGCRLCGVRGRLRLCFEPGDRVGHLEVVEVLALTAGRRSALRVLCHRCGSLSTISPTVLNSRRKSLLLGHEVSCGCARREILGQAGPGHRNWRGWGEISLTRWNGIKRHAADRGLAVEVEPDHAWSVFLLQDRRCALTGVDLTMHAPPGADRATASLDRIDSKCGYTAANIQWVHKDINLMKFDLSESDFIGWCRRVAAWRT